jgi:ubiquinone/menaquinone biosynthesis C-methylase UbiE
MRMNKATAFNALAGTYDAAFTESLIGHAQRRISHKWLHPLLATKPAMQLLEINCGTGADAFWMASLGHSVIATDGSPAMIDKAQQKTAVINPFVKPVFQTCAFDALHATFQNQQFNVIISNFAGLNCVSPADMKKLSAQLQSLIRPGGYLAVVLFGKYCLWDSFYYLLKGQPLQAFRRWTNKEVLVQLSPGVQQPVYYYSVKAFKRLLSPMQLIEKKPVGVSIPPSWLEAYMQQHPRLFHSLVQWEEKLAGASLFTSLADHAFLLFKKEAK